MHKTMATPLTHAPSDSPLLAALAAEVARRFEGVPEEQRDLPTALPWLTLMRLSHETPMGKGMLEPSMCLVLQGTKKLLVGSAAVIYGSGYYVLSAIDMPAAGQVLRASADAPYLALRISLSAADIAALIIDMQLPPPPPGHGTGAYVALAAPPLQDAFLRLLHLLDQPADLAALARLLKQEILYRLLSAEGAQVLYQSVLGQAKQKGVGAAILWIKDNFDQAMRIDDLARAASMSASVLHRRFKAITAMSPVQYQKQMRLLEARKLLLGGQIEAATVAFTVGYQSASQFGREYRRFFGVTPSQDSGAGAQTAPHL